ncbi:MarR family transcriptional regulator [Clostridium sp. AL.422]|uniref:MarR family winged helix-turn-helix transcriptional regulator n=1 Tax=Clostridium TaxID=1485 RepID=UPI00293DEA69|nr:MULTISPECIES: MarR family transcriptional regulator [unclassified Clostridium]MDV4149940.1 MarR family transcriptional regulator [Clostridium sp. AL.422]
MNNLSVIVRYCRNFFEKRLREFDLTFGEQVIIMFLSKNKDVNQDTISKRYMIDKGMVAKTLNKLETKGFILREQNPDNKRENIISLTEKGADILNNIKSIVDEWYEILYGEMSEEEIVCMKKLTNKMAENIANHMD